MTDTPELDASEGYLVEWAIDVEPEEADSPLDAARLAWRSLRDHLSIANVFEVTVHPGGTKFKVDLDTDEVTQLPDDVERCDYCRLPLGACDYMGLAHQTDAREAAGLCPHGWPLTGSCAGCGRGDAQPG